MTGRPVTRAVVMRMVMAWRSKVRVQQPARHGSGRGRVGHAERDQPSAIQPHPDVPAHGERPVHVMADIASAVTRSPRGSTQATRSAPATGGPATPASRSTTSSPAVHAAATPQRCLPDALQPQVQQPTRGVLGHHGGLPQPMPVRHDRSPFPRVRFPHHHEPPRLAVPDRRRRMRRPENTVQQVGIDGVGPEAPHVPPRTENVVQRLPLLRRKRPPAGITRTGRGGADIADQRYRTFSRH